MKILRFLVFFLCTTTIFAQKQEIHRPQFHFSPPSKWMNDPNGMVYFEGEYHLFYQYYPDSTVWGPMHWGHAISRDLMHWQHLPIALYPDSLGYIFSGSVVVDWKNSSGFGKNGQPPLVAIFTQHDMAGEQAKRIDFQYQSIAFSTDKGRTWTKYAQNPVIKNPGIKDFRDPKVIWHEATQYWVMVLAVLDRVFFYHSKDLKNWEKTGEFGAKEGSHGGVWECPDLFSLPVKGVKEAKKWVLLQSIGDGAPNGGSGTQYFIGDFDGKTFKNDNASDKILWLDYGTDNYAGVTFSDISKKDGRRIFIGWMSNWQYAQKVPTQSWRSAMTFPRELTLQQTPDGIRLFSNPVKELAMLRWRAEKYIFKNRKVSKLGYVISLPEYKTSVECIVEFDLKQTTSDNFGIMLNNSKLEKVYVGYDLKQHQLYIDRTNAGKNAFSPVFAQKHTAPHSPATNGIFKLRILIDVASVEVFADDGRTVMTDIFFPNEDMGAISIFAEDNGRCDYTTVKKMNFSFLRKK